VLELAVASGATAFQPASSYRWGQPGTAPVSVSHTQPPAWVPIGGATTFRPVSGYHWAQPGTAPVRTPDTQPPDTTW
jgi:hypothetical protein